MSISLNRGTNTAGQSFSERFRAVADGEDAAGLNRSGARALQPYAIAATTTTTPPLIVALLVAAAAAIARADFPEGSTKQFHSHSHTSDE